MARNRIGRSPRRGPSSSSWTDGRSRGPPDETLRTPQSNSPMRRRRSRIQLAAASGVTSLDAPGGVWDMQRASPRLSGGRTGGRAWMLRCSRALHGRDGTPGWRLTWRASRCFRNMRRGSQPISAGGSWPGRVEGHTLKDLRGLGVPSAGPQQAAKSRSITRLGAQGPCNRITG